MTTDLISDVTAKSVRYVPAQSAVRRIFSRRVQALGSTTPMTMRGTTSLTRSKDAPEDARWPMSVAGWRLLHDYNTKW